VNKDEVVQQVIKELVAQQGANGSSSAKEQPLTTPEPAKAFRYGGFASCGLTEFVGTNPLGDSIGMVIANIDPALHKIMNLPEQYRSLGIITARSGAGPHAMAGDEAVKSCNVELVMFEQSNDTKGGGGHGNIMLFGAEDVSDARRAVEITLQALEWAFGGVIGNENSFIEVQYTARASHVLSRYLNAELGKAWGLINGCPAGIGVLMSDAALKSADVQLTGYGSPQHGIGFTNEFTTFVTGDSGAVKQSIQTARDVGIQLLKTLGTDPKPSGREYF
jgi:microcompartment protein PduB